MMGLSRLAVRRGRGIIGCEPRRVFTAESAAVAFTWPTNRPRMVLDGDLAPSAVTDAAVGVAIRAEVFVGGVWVEWVRAGEVTGRVVGTVPPWVNTAAPPAGTAVRVSLIPLSASVAGGFTCRTATGFERWG